MKSFFLCLLLGGSAAITMAFSSRNMMTMPSKLEATKNKESSASWSEYKSDYIDPTLSNEDHTSLVSGPHVDKNARDSSDKYWLAQFEEEREKLHNMNDPWNPPSDTAAKKAVATTPFDQYKDDYLHEKEVEHKQVLKGDYVDKDVRAKADEFWLQTFLDEKAKLHGNKGSSGSGSSEDNKKATP